MKTIIEMAREAGFVEYELEDYTQSGYDIRYERFAALVRADERDRATRENAYVLAEREECAKVCEVFGVDAFNNDDEIYDRCAAAIRARGQQ